MNNFKNQMKRKLFIIDLQHEHISNQMAHCKEFKIPIRCSNNNEHLEVNFGKDFHDNMYERMSQQGIYLEEPIEEEPRWFGSNHLTKYFFKLIMNKIKEHLYSKTDDAPIHSDVVFKSDYYPFAHLGLHHCNSELLTHSSLAIFTQLENQYFIENTVSQYLYQCCTESKRAFPEQLSSHYRNAGLVQEELLHISLITNEYRTFHVSHDAYIIDRNSISSKANTNPQTQFNTY